MADSCTGDLGTLRTGVPGLDRVLRGGLAAPSLTLVPGPPGSGKTTLLHQVMFASVGPDRPALYVTLLGESPPKMLRYQARFAEVPNDYDSLTFSPQGAPFLSDDILLQRYVEIDGRLERVMAVVKMRNSPHSSDLHRCWITSDGIEIGGRLRSIRGILTGLPAPTDEQRSPWPELSRGERSVLDALSSGGESSVKQVAGSTGMTERTAERTLHRLVRLGYVLERRTGASKAPLYRATSRPFGGGNRGTS